MKQERFLTSLPHVFTLTLMFILEDTKYSNKILNKLDTMDVTKRHSNDWRDKDAWKSNSTRKHKDT